MVRNITGFAVFAFIAMIAMRVLLRVVFGTLGFVLSLVITVLTWAFIGFVIYTLLRIFAPGLASRIREVLRGPSSTS